MGNFQKVHPGQRFQPSAERENAITDLLNSFGRVGGGPGTKRASVDSLTVSAVAYHCDLEAGHPAAILSSAPADARKPHLLHAANWIPAGGGNVKMGVVVRDAKSAYATAVVVHGVAFAKLPASIKLDDDLAMNSRGEWTKAVDSDGFARVWALDGNGNALVYVYDAAGGSAGYDGYFKIINENGVIKVVDGASYNPETGTSNSSPVQVNNRRYEVPAQAVTLIEEYARSYIFLKFTAPVYNDAGRVETPAKVEVTAEAVQPSNTSQSAYYQIGRVFKEDSEIRIVQDHTSGVPQMWWFAICQ